MANLIFETKCNSCDQANLIDLTSNESREIILCSKCGYKLGKVHQYEGFVYVLSNQSMPNLYKIGFTNRQVNYRVEELNNLTSLPFKFNIEIVFPSVNPFYHEQLIHDRLDKYRVNEKREFFNCTYNRVFQVIHEITGNDPSYFRSKSLSNYDVYNYSPWVDKPNIKYSDKCPNCGAKGKVNHPSKNKATKFFCSNCYFDF